MNITKITANYRFKLIARSYTGWLKPNQAVLDIGAGTGIITKLLADYYSLKIKAADIKNYLIYDLPFVKIKNGKLPKPKIKYDVAMLNDVLHHLPKENQIDLIKKSLAIAHKVLIFEMKPTIGAKIFDTLLNKFHYGDLYIPLSFRDVSEWKELFKNLNIKVEGKTVKRPFWYPFSHIAFLIKRR